MANKPMPKQGNPHATHCRHCSAPKLVVAREVLMCETCDAPMIDGITIRPTWKPRLA